MKKKPESVHPNGLFTLTRDAWIAYLSRCKIYLFYFYNVYYINYHWNSWLFQYIPLENTVFSSIGLRCGNVVRTLAGMSPLCYILLCSTACCRDEHTHFTALGRDSVQNVNKYRKSCRVRNNMSPSAIPPFSLSLFLSLTPLV